MATTFLPSILVPIVGIVFPALSMALFFIYISIDDID
jgi:photosystem I subunit 8